MYLLSSHVSVLSWKPKAYTDEIQHDRVQLQPAQTYQ